MSKLHTQAEAVKDRDAQDHELAGGIAAPSLRPEADDGQWSEEPQEYEYDDVTQPMQGWYDEDAVIRYGAAVREMMREPYPHQAQQAGRSRR